MTDEELLNHLDQEYRQASAFQWGELADEREENLSYYLREPTGKLAPEEGRSQVVSSHVAETVEWILPDLIRIFTGSEKAVEFEPQEASDVEGAEQATDACNHVFYKQNDGFLILYIWLKDGLLFKTGAVKWWWDTKKTPRTEKYRGLTDEQLQMVVSEGEVEVVGHSQAAGPEGEALHDLDVRIKAEANKVCIAPIPPEELLVSRKWSSTILDDCPYVGHISRKSLSELRDMGFDAKPEDLQTDIAIDASVDRVLRDSRLANADRRDVDSVDPSMREGWVHDEYVLVDYDGDGVAERRHIIRSGKKKVWLNEETDQVQVAIWTPKIMPHTLVGMCPADEAKDLQLLGSTIWRQMLDNLYLSNNPQKVVLATPDGRLQANIDDLLISRPGGVRREYVPNAVRTDVTPWVAGQAFPMLEYIDQQRMNRTGANNLTSGLDADSINKTARGATIAENKQQMQTELIARVFAETGLKPLFRGVQRMLTRYSTKPMIFRLRNKFVSYDPRSWKTEYDMTINVGLGTGNKDQQLMHLQSIAQSQQVAIQMGGIDQLVTLKNVYNVQSRIAENAGFKNPEEFWTDPETVEPPPPQPNPEMEKIKMEAEAKQQEFQLKEAEMVANIELKREESEREFQLKQADMESKYALQERQNEAQLQFQRDSSKEQLRSQRDIERIKVNGQRKAEGMDEIHDEEMTKETAEMMQQVLMAMAQSTQALQQVAESMAQAAQVMAAPKVPVRNPKTGKIDRVVTDTRALQ